MTVYRGLLQYLRPYVWPAFATAILCMLLYSATNGLLPFLVERVFDDIFGGKNLAALKILPLVIVATFLFRGLMNFGHVYLTEYVGQHVVADLRNQLNDRIQHLPLSFFHDTPTGTILSRMTNDVTLIRNALTDAVASMMRDSASLVILTVVAFWMDWVLSLIAFVIFPATVLPLVKLSQRLRRFSRRGQVSLGRLTALLQETVQGNRVVKAFGMEDYEKRRFAQENDRLFRLFMKAGHIRALTTPMVELLAAFGIGAVVWYGGYSVIAGGRTQGSFLAFLSALFLVYEPFKHLSRANNIIQQGIAAAERLFELLNTPPEVEERHDARVLTGVREGIRFHKVSFRYHREFVLQEIDLEIAAGEVVALVGASGAGKSTLADLIPRFYDVTKGRITIDGTDIRAFSLPSLRAHIGLVTQFTFLFNDTVKNNIAYGDISKPLDHIVAAARAANAHDFIRELPEGYDTVIGELGVKLSGGQRQRLAIARALLKNPPILILDEATSSLDSESERLVQAAVERLMEGRTVLVIAHRLSTVRRADRIVVLARGQIVEQGRHDELLAGNATYRRLYDLQFTDVEENRLLPEAIDG